MLGGTECKLMVRFQKTTHQPYQHEASSVGPTFNNLLSFKDKMDAKVNWYLCKAPISLSITVSTKLSYNFLSTMSNFYPLWISWFNRQWITFQFLWFICNVSLERRILYPLYQISTIASVFCMKSFKTKLSETWYIMYPC